MTFISFAALVLVGVLAMVLALYVLMRRWL
jgi:hypothetical protein